LTIGYFFALGSPGIVIGLFLDGVSSSSINEASNTHSVFMTILQVSLLPWLPLILRKFSPWGLFTSGSPSIFLSLRFDGSNSFFFTLSSYISCLFDILVGLFLIPWSWWGIWGIWGLLNSHCLSDSY